MPESPMISVIVPVYQTEQYLQECLDSLSVQTYENLEFILIDDGSIDHSPEICDKRAAQDARFHAFHRTHAGIAASRNYGLKMAQGKFIAWVDSDDSIEPDYIQNLYDALAKNNTNMSFAMHRTNTKHTQILTGSEILQAQLDGKLGVLWSSLICASLYRNKLFPDYTANEDNIMLAQLCAQAQRAILIENAGYHYRIRHGSAVHTLDAGSMQNRLEALTARNTWIKRNYPNMYKYTHYTSVLEATKVNRMLRNNDVRGDTEVLRRTIKRMIQKHIFRIPISSLDISRVKEIAAGYKVLILGK